MQHILYNNRYLQQLGHIEEYGRGGRDGGYGHSIALPAQGAHA